MTASGQRRKVVDHVTASGQRRKVVDHVTASGHESDLPDELGNAHAEDVTGSDPKNATGHPENESVQAETGSGPKTATDCDVTAREGAQRVFVPIEI